MCLKPIYVSVRSAAPFSQRKGVAELLYRNDIKSKFVGTIDTKFTSSANQFMYVPCGKCLECAKNRQNSHAFRLYQHVKKCPRLYHITLTYRPSALPFAVSMNLIDKETGELFHCGKYSILKDEALLSECRSLMPKDSRERLPLYIYRDVVDFDDFADICDDYQRGYLYERIITPSIDRSAVRSALKVCRILFERKFGYKADFKYSFCGEYGPKTNRPHVHFVIASESDISQFVALFNSYWLKRYGRTKCKCINRFNKDNTDAFLIVARYISKYVIKGKYECESVRFGYAEKGRVCQSCNLDDEKLDVIKPYHLAYDLYGPYDVNTFTLDYDLSGYSCKDTVTDLLAIKRLNSEQISILVKTIRERLKVDFGYTTIPLPRYLKDKIFKYKDSHGKLKRSKISFLVSQSIQDFYTEREDKRFSRLLLEQDASSACKASKSLSEFSVEQREQNIKQNYEAFLRRSYF